MNNSSYRLHFYLTPFHLLFHCGDPIIFQWVFMSNQKLESSEELLYALLITQIPKDDYTDFLELSMNYISV
ncbi:MAG: hypothetical protein A2157_19915 [Deltaproteobacteria bacterium RBG_16_47_11]|nr:MAG: hypothetical protein A2157_19915 [Deltaproteobacteria bacterium RBG_16_47_11]